MKSSKIVYPTDKTGHENFVKDVHKQLVEVVHAPQKEGEKILQDVTKNGIVKDHIKWVKTCVNGEDYTYNCRRLCNNFVFSQEN